MEDIVEEKSLSIISCIQTTGTQGFPTLPLYPLCPGYLIVCMSLVVPVCLCLKDKLRGKDLQCMDIFYLSEIHTLHQIQSTIHPIQSWKALLLVPA